MHGARRRGLRRDEMPVIPRSGFPVPLRRQAQKYGVGGIGVTVRARDADSFCRSRTQRAAAVD